MTDIEPEDIDAMAMDYDEDGQPVLLIRLKPAVESVEITVTPLSPGPS